MRKQDAIGPEIENAQKRPDMKRNKDSLHEITIGFPGL